MSAVGRPAPRVLLACDYFIRYEAGLARGLRANGSDSILLGREHDLAFGGEPGAMRRYIRDRLGEEQPLLTLRGRVRDPGGWRAVPRIRRVLRQQRPDVTHVQYCITNDPRLLLAAGLRRHRYAVTVHDIDPHPGDPLPPPHQRAMLPLLTRNAGVVFVHADRLRDRMRERGLTDAPIVVVPHGVDDGDLWPVPAEPSLLFFGRISAYKGLPVLCDALEELWRRRPETTLTIAGEGPLPRHRVLADGRVRLLHRHVAEKEVSDLFAAASLVVLPYIEASQSGVGSLAKGHGRPLVVSAVGGLPELVSDGSGELVPAGDQHALADTLNDLLGDRARLQRMGDAGRRSVQERAGWPIVARLTLAAYEQHLGAAGSLDTRPGG